MAFDINKILTSAKKVAKNVGDKTSSTVETVKIKSKISSEKSAIEDVKKQIGQLVWDKFENGEIISEDFTELCETIRSHMNAIDDMQKSIEELKTKEDEEEVDEASEEAEEECTETAEVDEAVTETIKED